jgi:hypothetical protein
VPQTTKTYLVDMSCYADLGPDRVVLTQGKNQVTVNTGVREDELDAFLIKHNLMLKTVTAGGFFSLGAWKPSAPTEKGSIRTVFSTTNFCVICWNCRRCGRPTCCGARSAHEKCASSRPSQVRPYHVLGAIP